MQIPHESIFVSALRSFCKAVAVILGIFIAFLPIFFLAMFMNVDHDVGRKTTLNILPDAEGKIAPLSDRSPAILHINIHGIIGQDHLTAQDVRYQLIDSRTGLLKRNRVKAILLNVNTPGGKVGDSDSIYRQLLAYKKKYNIPIFAYVEDLCASGGMYIVCAADKIYSSPVGVIGSIGVVLGPFFNFVDVISRWGIESKTLTEGKDKDMMNPFRKWKENETASLTDLITYFYDRFVSIVIQARPRVQKDTLIQEYGAKVFDAPTAEKIGLIDFSNSTYNEALSALVEEANIKEAYQVIELLPKRKWMSLLSSMNRKISTLNKFLNHLTSGSIEQDGNPFSYIYKTHTDVQ